MMYKKLLHSFTETISLNFLTGITILFALLALFWGILPTVNNYKKKQTLNSQINFANQSKTQFKQLQNQKLQYQKKIGTKFSNEDGIHTVILNQLNEFPADKVVNLVSIQTNPSKQDDQKETYFLTELVLRGNYYHLLQLLEQLENQEGFGNIDKVDFYVEENRYEKEVDLFLKIQFRNIKFS